MILSFGVPQMPYNVKNPQDFDWKWSSWGQVGCTLEVILEGKKKNNKGKEKEKEKTKRAGRVPTLP